MMTRSDPAGLDRFLSPRSIAIVGASLEPHSIRGALLHLLRKNGFAGAIYPVNPTHREIDGLRCCPDVTAMGAPIDLAVIAIPAPAVPGMQEECAAAAVANATVISLGFAEARDSQVSRLAAAGRDRIAEFALNLVIVHRAGQGCSIAGTLLVLAPDEREAQ
jgi:acyl-CoA synthetase (NDP forming)